MRRWWLALAAAVMLGQNAEEDALRDALRETGSVPIEMIRAIERHLEKYPKSAKRAELERSIAKLAVDLRDEGRVVQYGERVLEAEPENLLMLERLSRALAGRAGEEENRRALTYARRLASTLERNLEAEASRAARLTWDDLDRAVSRAMVVQARAQGNLGQVGEAVGTAAGAWRRYPLAEAAREEGKWLLKQGDRALALEAYARAFHSPDPRASEEDRVKDRQEAGRIQTEVSGSEAGLGDRFLKAFDQVTAVMAARKARLAERSPNAVAGSPLEFTVTSLGGEKLSLKTLQGKVVVFDFWATWCGPCRRQHPLYEEVKKRFAGRSDVVFLALNTDEDRTVVADFVKENQWDPRPIYYDDGLAGRLQVSAIPTTVVFDRKGSVASRMDGFNPERFVDMLTERIQELVGR
jgi:thiol-disulfide isomerase/thioredoxin